MSLLRDWCSELLEKATGDPVPKGHTSAEEEYKWHGFATPGYRNSDVVNSMIAWGYMNPGGYEFDGYLSWLKNHVSWDDLDDVLIKVGQVEPYIKRYVLEPLEFLITTEYFTITDWYKMNTEWKEGIR